MTVTTFDRVDYQDKFKDGAKMMQFNAFSPVVQAREETYLKKIERVLNVEKVSSGDLLRLETVHLCEPLEYFCNNLIEALMYPHHKFLVHHVNRSEKLVVDYLSIDQALQLGHPKMLEVIYLRSRVQKIKRISGAVEMPALVELLQEVHSLMFNLFHEFKEHMKVHLYEEFYGFILSSQKQHFHAMMQLVQRYINIVEVNGKKKTSPVALLSSLKNFNVELNVVTDGMVRNSPCHREYERTTLDGLEDEGTDAHDQEIFDFSSNTEFLQFYKDRADRLKISARRLF